MATSFSKGYCDFTESCFLCIHYNWDQPHGKRIWVETRNHPLLYGTQKQNTCLKYWHHMFGIPKSHMSVSHRSSKADGVKSRVAQTAFSQPEQTVSLSAFLLLLAKSARKGCAKDSCLDTYLSYMYIIYNCNIINYI